MNDGLINPNNFFIGTYSNKLDYLDRIKIPSEIKSVSQINSGIVYFNTSFAKSLGTIIGLGEEKYNKIIMNNFLKKLKLGMHPDNICLEQKLVNTFSDYAIAGKNKRVQLYKMGYLGKEVIDAVEFTGKSKEYYVIGCLDHFLILNKKGFNNYKEAQKKAIEELTPDKIDISFYH